MAYPRNPYVNSYRDLVVYQKSRELAQKIFELSQDFPKDEKYSLTDQMRRASRSVGANIAESWGKRRYEKHFISKLTDADSEQYETQHWIDIAKDCGYIDDSIHQHFTQLCTEIGKLLGGMITNSGKFCHTKNRLRVNDEFSQYFSAPLDL